jgi:hypothetical protein
VAFILVAGDARSESIYVVSMRERREEEREKLDIRREWEETGVRGSGKRSILRAVAFDCVS